MSNNMSPFINTTISKNGELIEFITSIRISPKLDILTDNHPFETTIRMGSSSLKEDFNEDNNKEEIAKYNINMLANAAFNVPFNVPLN